MRRAVLLLSLFAIGGCPCDPDPETEPEVEVDEPDPETEPESPHGELPEPEEPPLARVVSGWDRGREIDTETIEVAEDAEPLVLDLRDGARVTLDPGTRAAVGEEAPAQVYLAEGALHTQLPPMGGSSRPELRVGTPAGTLVLEASGESYVIVAPDGRALFAQLAGLGRLYDGELDDERPSAIALRPGSSLVGGASDPTEGVGNVTAARLLREGFVNAGEDAPPARALDQRLEWLTAFMEAVQEERTRGQEIQRQRVIASQNGDAERGADLQRQLIAHSQVVSRQRARSLALLAEPEPDPSEAVLPRVRTLLGLEIPTPTILGDDEASADTNAPADSDAPATDQN
jgi:hypothetical protein